MKKLVILALALVGCAAQAPIKRQVSSVDRSDRGYAYHLEVNEDHLKAVRATQKEMGAPLMKVGPRCVPNFSEYAKEYPTFEQKIGDLADRAAAAIENAHLSSLEGGDLTPAAPDQSCGGEASVALGEATKNISSLESMLAALEPILAEVTDLQDKGLAYFHGEAGSHKRRAWNCLQLSQYDDVVNVAFSAVHDSAGEAVSGFDDARYSIKNTIEESNRQLDQLRKFKLQLEYARSRCGK